MKLYSFNPKFILESIVSIYSSFQDYPEFLKFIIFDERSYKIINFEKVISIKDKNKIKPNSEAYQKFIVLVDKLKILEHEIKQDQVNYDDAPEDFLDPITAIIMDDPVQLPSSKNIVDRNTIITHLLSDSTDPFNRSYLTKEMLIDCPELKLKIEEYKNMKINS
jgi:ubiquitin conjugation factor E4 B